MRRFLEAKFNVLLERRQLLLQLADLELRLLELAGERAQLAFQVIDANRKPGLVLAAPRCPVIVDFGRRTLPIIGILRELDARRRCRFGVCCKGGKQQRAREHEGAGKARQHELVPARIVANVLRA